MSYMYVVCCYTKNINELLHAKYIWTASLLHAIYLWTAICYMPNISGLLYYLLHAKYIWTAKHQFSRDCYTKNISGLVTTHSVPRWLRVLEEHVINVPTSWGPSLSGRPMTPQCAQQDTMDNELPGRERRVQNQGPSGVMLYRQGTCS